MPLVFRDYSADGGGEEIYDVGPIEATTPLQRFFNKIGLKVPVVWLPKFGKVDMSKWAVIACDQKTADEKYWEDVDTLVGDSPSTLRTILPEIHLGKKDKLHRVRKIHSAMRDYLRSGILTPQKPGFVLVDRETSTGHRHGLVVALDLEQYDYSPDSTSLIRPTEGTIPERIPPRKEIREGAPMEVPHIMVLIDDPEDTVIGPLSKKASDFNQLYDFDLMLGGGHINGRLIDDPKVISEIAKALGALADPQVCMEKYGAPREKCNALYFVGDGNHSLATAKAIWEEKKRLAGGLDAVKDDPARYALVELVNIHDSSLKFEPIHRVLYNVGFQNMLQEMESFYEKQGSKFSYHPFEINTEYEKYLKEKSEDGSHIISTTSSQGFGVIVVEKPKSNLTVDTLQSFLDYYLKHYNGPSLDYVHEPDIVAVHGADPEKSNVSFFLPPLNKNELVRYIIEHGPLPRKTFSMGEAEDKRYYLEGRVISPEDVNPEAKTKSKPPAFTNYRVSKVKLVSSHVEFTSDSAEKYVLERGILTPLEGSPGFYAGLPLSGAPSIIFPSGIPKGLLQLTGHDTSNDDDSRIHERSMYYNGIVLKGGGKRTNDGDKNYGKDKCKVHIPFTYFEDRLGTRMYWGFLTEREVQQNIAAAERITSEYKTASDEGDPVFTKLKSELGIDDPRIMWPLFTATPHAWPVYFNFAEGMDRIDSIPDEIKGNLSEQDLELISKIPSNKFIIPVDTDKVIRMSGIPPDAGEPVVLGYSVTQNLRLNEMGSIFYSHYWNQKDTSNWFKAFEDAGYRLELAEGKTKPESIGDLKVSSIETGQDVSYEEARDQVLERFAGFLALRYHLITNRLGGTQTGYLRWGTVNLSPGQPMHTSVLMEHNAIVTGDAVDLSDVGFPPLFEKGEKRAELGSGRHATPEAYQKYDREKSMGLIKMAARLMMTPEELGRQRTEVDTPYQNLHNFEEEAIEMYPDKLKVITSEKAIDLFNQAVNLGREYMASRQS
ncbi:MAG: DUF1015 domain-containing protein [Candidatus Altiarchaeota archaeon]